MSSWWRQWSKQELSTIEMENSEHILSMDDIKRIKIISEDCVPFHAIKEVLRDFVYVEDFFSGEVKEEAAPQSHLPKLLGGLVWIQTAVAQQETN